MIFSFTCEMVSQFSTLTDVTSGPSSCTSTCRVWLKKTENRHTHTSMTLSPHGNVCVCVHRAYAEIANHRSQSPATSHPPAEPYPHALSGWCCHDNRASVTDRHARRRGDSWVESCHLGQLMTGSQQVQALTHRHLPDHSITITWLTTEGI